MDAEALGDLAYETRSKLDYRLFPMATAVRAFKGMLRLSIIDCRGRQRRVGQSDTSTKWFKG